jgi:hypothetical protein
MIVEEELSIMDSSFVHEIMDEDNQRLENWLKEKVHFTYAQICYF